MVTHDPYLASYLKPDGKAFIGPPILGISRDGVELTRAEIPPSTQPGDAYRYDEVDALVEELGYRVVGRWRRTVLAASVEVEPLATHEAER